jgi:chromate transporter
MNLVVVYFLLLKATVTSFSGLASLPVVHADFVEKYHILTESQLNTAVAAGRTSPGPVGVYIVNVGYLAAGVPGAIAGWIAMVTPAFLVLPLLHYCSRYAGNPRVRSAIRAIMLSSAGLLLSSTVPLGKAALTNGPSIVIALASLGILVFTKVETLWVVLGAAAAGLGLAVAGLA